MAQECGLTFIDLREWQRTCWQDHFDSLSNFIMEWGKCPTSMRKEGFAESVSGVMVIRIMNHKYDAHRSGRLYDEYISSSLLDGVPLYRQVTPTWM